jgi:transposase-like protein
MMQAINNTHSRTHAQPCGHTLTHAYCLDVPMDTHVSSNQEHPLTHARAAACAHACTRKCLRVPTDSHAATAQQHALTHARTAANAHKQARVVVCACQLTCKMQQLNNTHSRMHAQLRMRTRTHAELPALVYSLPAESRDATAQQHVLMHARAAACAHMDTRAVSCGCHLTRRMQQLNNTHSRAHAQLRMRTGTHT